MRLEARNVGAVLDDAVAMYRSNFKSLFRVSLLSIFPVALASGVAGDFYFRGILEQTVGMAQPAFTGGIAISYLVLLASSMVMTFVRYYHDCAVLTAAPRLLAGERPGWREIMRNGLSRFGWYLLIQWLVSMIIGMGVFTLYIGSAFAAVWLSMAGVVVVVEGGTIGYAFSRSIALVKGNAWRVLGWAILAAVLMSLFRSAVASPIAIRQVVASIQNPEAIFQSTAIGWKFAEGLMLAIASTLPAAFMPLATFSLYLDLRVRNEGVDLVMRAQELSKVA
ncbi:MAG: hypothetical protein JXE06_05860 [Coriobacteriia bacterium]|nr:hypothetical protein [Coriobacteriia bacterium]MBN2822501.1 hypothetical protein [Coriobacteriia bacterium]